MNTNDDVDSNSKSSSSNNNDINYSYANEKKLNEMKSKYTNDQQMKLHTDQLNH